MTLPPDLKPCPFCNERPRLTVRPNNAEATEHFAAVACYCGGYSACAHKMATAPEADEAQASAIAAWNRRAAIAAHVPEAVCGNIAAVPAQPVASLAIEALIAAGFVSRDKADEAVRIMAPLAAAPQAVPVPAGWVMVPVEPTAAMNQAADNVKLGDRESGEITLSWDEYEAIYRAMRAASPKEQP